MSDQNFQDDQSTQRSIERKEAELDAAARERLINSPTIRGEAERVVDAQSFIVTSIPDVKAYNTFAELTDTRDLPTWLANDVSAARSTVSRAFDEITNLANGNGYAPERADKIKAHQAAATEAAEGMAKKAELVLRIDQEAARNEALELPTGRAATDLFHEARGYLSMSKNPADTFNTLVERGDDVAKMLASPKGHAMLLALGVEHADRIHKAAGDTIVRALAGRGDQKAAKALDLAPGGKTYRAAQKAIQATQALARVTAEGRGKRGRA